MLLDLEKLIYQLSMLRILMAKRCFVVHRDEILKKSQTSFKNVWPEKKSGFFNAEKKDTKSDIIFASIQTLYRPENLEKFNRNHF